MKKSNLSFLFITLLLLLPACTAGTTNRPGVVNDTELPEDWEPVIEENPSAPPSPVPFDFMPPEPQNVTFQTPQDRTLQGRYFPAVVENAPLIVLIHWIMANQDDWQVVASWLQNRGQTAVTGSCSAPSPCPWWNLSWFPFVGERTYAVFTFSLSGCEEADGCTTFAGQAWAEDANAAILYASQLEGVDPEHIVTAGASIGADAAIDSCAWLNAQGGTPRCVGSLAFSPGSYLGLDYSDQVTALGTAQPILPAWCLYAQGDGESLTTCRPVSGINYQKFEYAGSDHGMNLIKPDLTPKDSSKSTLEIFLDFLDLTLTP